MSSLPLKPLGIERLRDTVERADYGVDIPVSATLLGEMIDYIDEIEHVYALEAYRDEELHNMTTETEQKIKDIHTESLAKWVPYMASIMQTLAKALALKWIVQGPHWIQ